jgi:hypothetical protein
LNDVLNLIKGCWLWLSLWGTFRTAHCRSDLLSTPSTTILIFLVNNPGLTGGEELDYCPRVYPAYVYDRTLYKEAGSHSYYLSVTNKLPPLLSGIIRHFIAIMFDEYIQSKFLRRLARFSCSVVRTLSQSHQHMRLRDD